MMKHVYKRGVGNILGHILKFMNLMHVLANVTGTYGVWCFKEWRNEYGKVFRTESAFKEEEILFRRFFVDFIDDIL